ncbi:MAG: AbrB/MazE/SpoVT family DNA-binding domain-containing protein [Candidatus Cloacimonetes bacterium]|nr:AbrB/MazE/SpoVT family DNA-binding domain-containing protein [Candidatus Cloacimonadota bacterium]
MELSTLSSKGQITIPLEIRQKMNLKTGDKVFFFEENGKYYLQNTNSMLLSEFQSAMEGAAKEAGFNNPDDVEEYIKMLRKSDKG